MELQDMQLAKNNIWQRAKTGSNEMRRLVSVCGEKDVSSCIHSLHLLFQMASQHFTTLHMSECKVLLVGNGIMDCYKHTTKTTVLHKN